MKTVCCLEKQKLWFVRKCVSENFQKLSNDCSLCIVVLVMCLVHLYCSVMSSAMSCMLLAFPAH